MVVELCNSIWPLKTTHDFSCNFKAINLRIDWHFVAFRAEHMQCEHVTLKNPMKSLKVPMETVKFQQNLSVCYTGDLTLAKQ